MDIMIRKQRKIIDRTLCATLLGVALPLFSANAFATPIDLNVLNPGFEEPDDAFTEVPTSSTSGGTSAISDWDIYIADLRSGPGQYYGVFTPDGTFYSDPLNINGQVAYLDLRSDITIGTSPEDGPYPVGLQQELDPTENTLGGIDYSLLRENSRYDLNVMVGNPHSGRVSSTEAYNYDGFGGYRIELIAGGISFEVDDNSVEWVPGDPNDPIYDPTHPDYDPSAPVPDEGTFKQASLYFVTGNSLFVPDPVDDTAPHIDLIGMALGIRLINKNADIQPNPLVDPDTGEVWYSGIGFDDVSLTVSAVPVPAAVWLFGTALLGMFGFSKRRKSN